MNSTAADLSEIFSSIQGEGPLVGVRQIFIRFCGCNIACDYCDTRQVAPPPTCSIETNPGRRDFVQFENPVAFNHIESLVSRWRNSWPNLHHSLSITGGEPLLSATILAAWLPVLRRIYPIFLETNGILHDELQSIVDYVDFVSMDIKLPSTSGIDSLWEDHGRFLAVASARNVLVKSVVGRTTSCDEVRQAASIISRVDRAIPFVLQPQTLANGSLDLLPDHILGLQEAAAGLLKDVRVIPQTHRIMDIL